MVSFHQSFNFLSLLMLSVTSLHPSSHHMMDLSSILRFSRFLNSKCDSPPQITSLNQWSPELSISASEIISNPDIDLIPRQKYCQAGDAFEALRILVIFFVCIESCYLDSQLLSSMD